MNFKHMIIEPRLEILAGAKSERLAPLGIMGPRLMAPLKPLKQLCSMGSSGFKGGPELGPHDSEGGVSWCKFCRRDVTEYFSKIGLPGSILAVYSVYIYSTIFIL